MKIICLIFFCFAFLPSYLLHAEQSDDTSTVSNSKDTEESELLPKIEQIFDNPFLVQTLNAGSQVANNAFDSLLEVIFYQLLDQKFTQKLTGTISLNEAVTRQVFSTGQGKYVIADRINIGPQYQKSFPNLFKKLPTHLIANTSIDLLGIYLRSDPQRTIEKQILPTWRYWVNVWFGFIPFLEQVLPPAFDPNQLYDPLREIVAPLSFPVDLETFQKMETGSIQSYAFQGSIALPINIDGASSAYLLDVFQKANLNISIPYTLFVQGEYRINVLKKSKKIAWVGLSKLKRGGHSLAGYIGSTIYLLSHSLGKIPWKGVPLQFSPIDVSAIEALANKYDQLYEFDLSKPAAITAFQQAIGGDFTFGKDKKNPPGVRFHFSQDSVSVESQQKNAKNLFLIFKASSDDTNSKSEVKIVDDHGSFYVLENTKTYNTTQFNVFTGEQVVDLSNEIYLNVEKVRDKNYSLDDPKFVYQFHPSMKPYQFIIKLQIKDRLATVEDFYKYVELLRETSRLPLEGIPDIPLISEKNRLHRNKSAFFSSPNDTPYTVHQTTTSIGKFSANAIIIFDSNEIKEILSKNSTEFKEAFYKAYDRDEEEDISPFLEYTRSYIMYPFRVFDYKSREIDGYREIAKAVNLLSKSIHSKPPSEMISSFKSLFQTDYPIELISAFYSLVDIKKIPRIVNLYISPSRELDEISKKSLSSLNQKTYMSEAKFPEQERYRIAKSKLNSFVPASLQLTQKIPSISNISISNRQTMRIALNRTKTDKKLFFIRIQSIHQFKISETNLGEKLIELEATCIDKIQCFYEFPLLSEDSPIFKILNPHLLKEDTSYSISISASSVNGPWSEESYIQVRFKNHRLEVDNEGE
jgi:hypothetical protein